MHAVSPPLDYPQKGGGDFGRSGGACVGFFVVILSQPRLALAYEQHG